MAFELIWKSELNLIFRDESVHSLYGHSYDENLVLKKYAAKSFSDRHTQKILEHFERIQ